MMKIDAGDMLMQHAFKLALNACSASPSPSPRLQLQLQMGTANALQKLIEIRSAANQHTPCPDVYLYCLRQHDQ